MNSILLFATVLNWTFLQPNAQFWSFWSDSKAEIGYYKGTQMRYGEVRPCKSFLIFVTEPFNGEKQVKADNPDGKNKIYNGVMKLNHVKRFQTGIYTYSIMSSVFTPVTPSVVNNSTYNVGAPLKITFTGQEWCGMTFHQLNRQADKSMKSRSNSYFESEGDREETLKSDENTLFGDDAFIAVRELTRPLNTGNVTFYPTLEHARISHKALAPEPAAISKKDVNTRFAGTNTPSVEWSIVAQSGTWTFTVEKQYPRRILAFQYTEQGKVIEKAELQTSTRLPYWKLNKLGDEHFLTELDKTAK